MEFLERFKGKTNQLTREGIISTITASSTPINKNSQQEARAPSNGPSHKEKKPLTNPKTKRTQYRKAASIKDMFQAPREPLENQDSPNSLRVITSEENLDSPMFEIPQDSSTFNRRAHTGQHPHSQGLGLINKDHLINTHPISKGDYFLKRSSESNLYVPMRYDSYTTSHGKVSAAEYANQKLKSLFDNISNQSNIYSHENPYYSRSNFGKNFEEKNSLQEARLSKFSFIERQEHLISKYKVRPGKEEEIAYKTIRANYSPEKMTRMIFVK